MHLDELVPILQVAVGPVILISGVGLLLLSMTNRLGRVVDRSRSLADILRRVESKERGRLTSELRILSTRARLIQRAITLAALSVLLAAFLVIALFFTALLRLNVALLIIFLFTACLASLIGSLLVFIKDINLSLEALKLEIEFSDERVG